MIFLLLLANLCISTTTAFGAPGIVPPESFIAERWYPTNLPTVMPPWKMPGVDISHFRTARPHQSPGTSPRTTTPAAPTNSLPMPPGSQLLTADSIPTNGPHPPAPPQIEASGALFSAENDTDSPVNSTMPSNSDELMTVSVTSTNERPEPGMMKILSPIFEDITKVDNISDSEEVLRVSLHSDKPAEGSGDIEPELMSTLETTTPFSKTLAPETTTLPLRFITAETMPTTESPTTTVPRTESSEKPVTEPISSSSTTFSSSSTTTTTISSLKTTVIDIPDEVATKLEKPEIKSRPTKECKDILFLLDSSGNVLQQYEKQKRYIEEIVKQLESKHSRRMALITFAGRTRQKIVVPLPEEPNGNKFVEKLKKARFLRGVTAAGAAISVTTQYVLQKSRNVQVVMVTDGFSFDDVDQQSEALRTVIGSETYVTGRYFPVVKNVLGSIGGTDDHVFFDKKEQRLIDALQC